MGVVLKFPKKNNKLTIGTYIFNSPSTAGEYINICHKILTPDDYEEMLCSITDKHYYEASDDQIKDLVDHYHSYSF